MEDYTGLGAIAWELFSGEEPGADHDFFRRLIEASGGPALDMGCGTGRLLLAYLSAGLEVEGVDPSADMLAICRQRAEARGLTPVLYQQTMQALELPRRYRTIFVPCGTIQLVIEREEAFEALRRFHAHLEPGGTLVLTVFNRWREQAEEQLGEWKFRARAPLPDGTELAKHARGETCNLVEQTLTMTVRYQRLQGERVLEEQLCPAPERWYFKHEMTLMLEKFGFRDIRVTGNYTDAEFSDPHYVMAFIATR
jgi:ubiquinone/menaquinone biosynthesis C-methylase UbiE